MCGQQGGLTPGLSVQRFGCEQERGPSPGSVPSFSPHSWDDWGQWEAGAALGGLPEAETPRGVSHEREGVGAAPSALYPQRSTAGQPREWGSRMGGGCSRAGDGDSTATPGPCHGAMLPPSDTELCSWGAPRACTPRPGHEQGPRQLHVARLQSASQSDTWCGCVQRSAWTCNAQRIHTGV